MNGASEDEMECGCYWTRTPDWGDVLSQCKFHKDGGEYEGSEPLSEEELGKFRAHLEAGGFGTEVLFKGKGDKTTAEEIIRRLKELG